MPKISVVSFVRAVMEGVETEGPAEMVDDAEAARTAMRLHLETSRDRLFEGRLLDLSFR